MLACSTFHQSTVRRFAKPSRLDRVFRWRVCRVAVVDVNFLNTGNTLLTQMKTMSQDTLAPPTATKTIVETAVGNGSFDTLVAAVTAADLVATLSSEGPFTVMAPTDAAFAKLPAGTVESLVKPENKEKLASILTYHVVAGSVPAATVVTLKEADTVNGSKITIEVKDGSVFLNGDTKVVITDVHCSNGIIHAIDTVLMPPSA